MAPSITGLGDVGRFLHDGLARLVPDIPALAVRFPWPLVALLTTIVIVTFDESSLARLIVHGPATQALQPIDNVVVALIGALLALTALALVAEGQGWSRGRLHAMSALACLALAALAVAAIWRWT